MGLNEMQKKVRADYLENNLMITECSQNRKYAFISYASDDWETVFKQAVIPLQQQDGLCVYADKAFDKLNDKWVVPMLRNVRGSDLMIAFVSQNYIESYACFLELLTAMNNQKQVVFVDLGGKLYLGKTTDQPEIERSVKGEILKQGETISTNTNNNSNDLMRAIKSSFTSISTLLEQDVLSKYDISDAFINFFRDASINKKSINDIKALKRTIKSVSSSVFDKTLVQNSRNQAPHIPAESVPLQGSQAETGSAEQIPLENQPEVSPIVQTPEKTRSEADPADDYRFDEPERKAPAGFGARLRGKKSVPILAGAAAGLAVIILAFVLISSRSKYVTAMSYEYSIQAENRTQLYAGVYTGEWKNNKPFKQGTFTYVDTENSFVYEGEWDKGLANGQGTMTYANGDVYEGEYLNGQRNGQGTATFAEDDASGRRDYTGQWENGKRSGTGTMNWTSGQVYEGEWKDNQRNGQGTQTYANGDVYEGEWKDGQRSGQGTLTFAKDDEYGRYDYTGQWENDKRNGQGTMNWTNGQVYEGEWKNDQKSGQGTQTFPEGDKSGILAYVGQWENDKANGQGKYTMANGEAYEGEFLDFKRNGQGTMTFAKDDKYGRRDYVGQWENDKRNGQGTMTWTNGAVYEGEWKDGSRNGQGKYKNANGEVYEGEWKDDKFVE